MNQYSGEIDVPSEAARKEQQLRLPLIALVLVVVGALFIYTPYYVLRFGPLLLDELRYIVLDLQSGFASMVLALYLLFTLPFLLSRLSAGRRRGSGRAGSSDSTTSGGSSGPVFSSDISEDQVSVPSMALREMGASERGEMATALGIPWRDELILDHESWEAACHEATEREAKLYR